MKSTFTLVIESYDGEDLALALWAVQNKLDDDPELEEGSGTANGRSFSWRIE